MKIRAPPGREESMERTKDFYNGMNYAKKQLQQREHERRRRKRYFIKQKLCGIATFAVLVIATTMNRMVAKQRIFHADSIIIYL